MGEIDYEWMLRPLLAERGVHSYAELGPLLAKHGVHLSESQVWRLFTGKPERLNLHTLMVLCRILDCTPNDLIKPLEVPAKRARRPAAGGGAGGLGDLKPKRARIRPARNTRQ
jgi:DNA-binding Xre family transcriptional regulator